MSLLSLFQNSVRQANCIPAGSRVLVAVSGGADSVALLALLHRCSAHLGIEIEAAHLDHCLRDASAEDALFVQKLCTEFSVHLSLDRQDVGAMARQCKGNLEEVARDVRREFLLAAAAKRGCDLIALGHHADDQAETFLMQLLRGAGSTGLAGMRVLNGKFVRPLLSFRRHQLADYLNQNGIDWCDDASNFDQRFTRNRIRHELLPLLETFNPNVASLIAGYCAQLRQDEDFWADLVAVELASCATWQNAAYTIDGAVLSAMNPALAGRLVRAALLEVRGDLRNISAAHVESVLRLLAQGPVQGELDLPGVWVARRYDKLMMCRERPEADEFTAMGLPGEGRYRLPDGRTLSLLRMPEPSEETVNSVVFSMESLSFPLQLRRPLPGDRFRPSGMAGTKKIQDLFVDLKLTKEERQNALLLLHGDEVIWVVGLRRCEGRWPVPGSEVLRVVIEPQF